MQSNSNDGKNPTQHLTTVRAFSGVSKEPIEVSMQGGEKIVIPSGTIVTGLLRYHNGSLIMTSLIFGNAYGGASK